MTRSSSTRRRCPIAVAAAALAIPPAAVIGGHAGPGGATAGGAVVLAATLAVALLVQRSAWAGRADRRLATLLYRAADIIGICSADGSVRYVTPSCERILGYTQDELLGYQHFDRVHPDDLLKLISSRSVVDSPGETVRSTYRIRHRDGRWVTLENSITNLLHDPDVRGIVWNARDISDEVALRAQLDHDALHDPLTGLPNRRLLADRLAHALERGRRTGSSVALIAVGVDAFRVVNETMGHEVGDAVLRGLAARLRATLRTGDTLARIGGDEFTVLLEGVGGAGVGAAEAVAAAVERLLAAVREPFRVGGRDLHLTASCGYVVTDDGQERAEELQREAELAMSVAEHDGGDRARRFEPSLLEVWCQRAELGADLHDAVEHNELRLVFQPTVRVADGVVIGVETLLRWTHPARGPVPPSVFIPIAEEGGQIVPIGRWVLEEACTYGRIWARRHRDFTLAVNVSARQLAEPGFPEDVRAILDRTGFDAHHLVLEVTETALVRDTGQALDALNALKSLGVRLAVDDFGTGYSTLAQLQRFPMDIVKVDKSFVDHVTEAHGAIFVRTIVQLASELGMETIAEGVETEDQHEALTRMGCTSAQGYFFGRPMGPAHFDEYVAHESVNGSNMQLQ